MPAVIPVTTPEDALTVAMDGALLVQVPNGAELASVVVLPATTVKVPVMAPGVALTVISV